VTDDPCLVFSLVSRTYPEDSLVVPLSTFTAAAWLAGLGPIAGVNELVT
jgi:hypothetical protein